MNQAAMQEGVTWGALWMALSACGALGAFLVAVVTWLWTKHAKHDSDLADFKIKVAETYVTTAAFNQMEARITSHIDQLGAKVDRMTDRVIANLAASNG